MGDLERRLTEEDAQRVIARALAFAMLRFGAGAAHPHPGHVPAGMPRLGEDVYIFAPSGKKVPCEDVPRFLAELPAPATLFPTTTRGVVALLLLHELSDERATWARREGVP